MSCIWMGVIRRIAVAVGCAVAWCRGGPSSGCVNCGVPATPSVHCEASGTCFVGKADFTFSQLLYF